MKGAPGPKGYRKNVTCLAVYLCIFLLVPLVSICGTGDEGAGEASEEDRALIPDYILNDVVHHYYEDGVKKVKIVFETGRYFSVANELLVEKCSFVYYDKKGEVVSRGNSKYARLFSDGTELIAEEDVVVISEENKGRLNTEYLEWHGNENQFTTDRFVTITQENGDTISGVGMVADIGLKKVSIKKDVKGSFREKAEM
jgi:LPS export ABC transporter protein LptC